MAAMHRYDAGRTLPILHAAKLTAPHLAVLEFVRDPRTVSEMAAHIGLSLPATSQMVQKLVQRRLVRRSEGATDRRERAVTLTSRGAALLTSIAEARSARFDASLAALPASVAARLAAALTEAVEALDCQPALPGSKGRAVTVEQ